MIAKKKKRRAWLSLVEAKKERKGDDLDVKEEQTLIVGGRGTRWKKEWESEIFFNNWHMIWLVVNNWHTLSKFQLKKNTHTKRKKWLVNFNHKERQLSKVYLTNLIQRDGLIQPYITTSL